MQGVRRRGVPHACAGFSAPLLPCRHIARDQREDKEHPLRRGISMKRLPRPLSTWVFAPASTWAFAPASTWAFAPASTWDQHEAFANERFDVGVCTRFDVGVCTRFDVGVCTRFRRGRLHPLRHAINERSARARQGCKMTHTTHIRLRQTTSPAQESQGPQPVVREKGHRQRKQR